MKYYSPYYSHDLFGLQGTLLSGLSKSNVVAGIMNGYTFLGMGLKALKKRTINIADGLVGTLFIPKVSARKLISGPYL